MSATEENFFGTRHDYCIVNKQSKLCFVIFGNIVYVVQEQYRTQDTPLFWRRLPLSEAHILEN